MRKFLITTAALAATAVVGNVVKAQPYYGGMMGGMVAVMATAPATA